MYLTIVEWEKMSEQKKSYLGLGILFCCSIPLLASCSLGRRSTPTPIAITLPSKLMGRPAAPTQATYTVQAGEVSQGETYTGRAVPAH